jgi:O-antigen/teichoic acid export membrane protein
MLAVVMAIPLSVIVVFAPDLLRVWLGGQYAVESANALRVLAIGVFANTLAQPLFVTLYARNRPDLPAKFHLIELGLHLPTTILLIKTFGITGAAVAWTARVILDLCLLFWAAARTSKISVKDLAGGRAVSGAVVVALLLAGLVVSKLLASISVAVTAVVALGIVAIFIVASWLWVFRDAERSAIRGMLRSYYPSFDRMSAA